MAYEKKVERCPVCECSPCECKDKKKGKGKTKGKKCVRPDRRKLKL